MRPITLAFLAATTLASLAGIAAAPLAAQQAPMAIPGQPDPSRITGGTYTVDPSHTLVGWRINHLGFNDYFGSFGNVTGTLTLDPKAPGNAKLDVDIPISSLSVVSAKLAEHLKSPDFFNLAQFASAHFTATGVTVSGRDAVINGNLTLRGVTKPISLTAHFVGAGTTPPMMGGHETIGFHAHTSILRSDFGMTSFLPMLGDAVDLDISAAFQK